MKVVLITGASRGIGRNMALLFARNGFTVVGTGRDQEKLNELEADLHQYAKDNQVFAMDVKNLDQVEETIRRINSEFGGIDICINNAGSFTAVGKTWEVKPYDWIHDVETNLAGTFHCVHTIIPFMLQRNGGRIINVTGGGSVGPLAYGSAYGTSKTAIVRFTENLAAELHGSSIKVFAMDPGLNLTDLNRNLMETEEGKRYFPGFSNVFAENKHSPDNWAPELALAIARGHLDPYEGRVLNANDDYHKLIECTDQMTQNDLYVLRMNRLQGMERGRF